MGTPTWDHEQFREYVIARAKTLGVADSTADLARATGIGHGMLSKWFRGQERPSPTSLQKLSTAIKAPMPELLVLAGHARQHEVGMSEAPTAPAAPDQHPTVARLARTLGSKSRLSDQDRQQLAILVDRVIDSYSTQNRRRSA